MSSRSITPARASFGFATAAPTRRSLIPTGSPAVSHRMHGDLHPWQPPCRHGWHAAPGPRQDVVGWEPVGHSGGAPGTRPTRSTSAALWMGVTWPVSPKQRLASFCRRIILHRRPSRRSAQVTHHTTDVSSVRGPRPWGPTQAFPRHGGRGRLGASGVTCTITLTSDGSWNPLTEPVGLKAATGIAGSVHHRGEGRRPRHTSREPAPQRPSAGRSGNNATDLGVSLAGKPGTR